MPIGRGAGLMARMNFEVLDRGSSRGGERFKVSTRSYLYSIQQENGEELVSAHWHPTGNSRVTFPHWHFGGPVLSETGVFLKRAHIPSPRIAFERIIRMAIEDVPGVEPTCDDWRDRLDSTESAFDQYKSWD